MLPRLKNMNIPQARLVWTSSPLIVVGLRLANTTYLCPPLSRRQSFAEIANRQKIFCPIMLPPTPCDDNWGVIAE